VKLWKAVKKEYLTPKSVFLQCFGSGSALVLYLADPGIRIRDLYSECGSRIWEFNFDFYGPDIVIVLLVFVIVLLVFVILLVFFDLYTNLDGYFFGKKRRSSSHNLRVSGGIYLVFKSVIHRTLLCFA